ncbi:unnamed protein product [Adineta steineri]|nr:unnamed protein product [Adineta steineri]CAF0946135.1 unnamed protein product [Adineta steineri]
MPVCIKCQVLTSTSKRCPYCRICYCSKACRSTDWSRHKSECRSGEGVTSSSNSSNEIQTEGFAKPGTYREIHCKGRPCVNCGRCCDWQFKGDLETWRWIQNYKNWNLDDNKRWISLYPPDFERRSDATCSYEYSSPHYFHYLNFYSRGELGGPLSNTPGPFF